MAINVDTLTPKQLTDLIARAQQRQENLDQERVGKVRAKLAALAKAEGFTLEQVLGTAQKQKRGPKRKGKIAKAKKPPLPPKYRNPADPKATWSGRGKRPNWFNAALKAGKKEKDLLIR